MIGWLVTILPNGVKCWSVQRQEQLCWEKTPTEPGPQGDAEPRTAEPSSNPQVMRLEDGDSDIGKGNEYLM